MSDAARHFVTFDESASGERLDRALALALPALTRSRVKALIEGRRVTLADGTTIEEPSRKVKTGDRFVVDIPEPEPATPLPQTLPTSTQVSSRRWKSSGSSPTSRKSCLPT